ncbi:ABC transporter permease [Cryobacterium psychrophilum]|uniref:ABC transporter permease n=1 Tax=Cryobacterium psychrophilum TaxID=41988 RepID=A0A4Y8KMS1_9MICO|nr:ABC transporter permease [Cryobacterium psychrophilum]TDW31202.1 NitT/TauT family transport system permease protein [Cryobacterium psychrophilum]TFD78505.1 ABC transporter permease [Cryobacterium psychrophilum]
MPLRSEAPPAILTDRVDVDAVADADERRLSSGLDALQTVPAAPRGRTRQAIDGVLPPVLLILGLIVAWQISILVARPRPDLIPGPLDVLSSISAFWADGRLQLAVLTSLERGGIGFLIAVAIGTPIGLLLAECRPVRHALGPLLSGLQVLPSVAWVPAAIIWFGLTDATVYFVVLMGAVPSIANGLVSGIDHVPPQLRRVGTVLGASRVQLATLVILPAALPGYFSGLKQGWAFAWRSLMAAEIIAMGGTIGFGLGSMLDQSRELADLPGVLATIVVILFVGILVELVLFAPLERRLLRRRGLVPAGRR